jgi:hypothetical protein
MDVACFYLDVAKVDLVFHMLQWLYTYVASVFLTFQLFQTYVTSILFDVTYVVVAIHICCKIMF